MPRIFVINKFEVNHYGGLEVDTTSHGNNKEQLFDLLYQLDKNTIEKMQKVE